MKRGILSEKEKCASLHPPPSPFSAILSSEGSSPSSSDKENQDPVYPLGKDRWKAALNEMSSPEILKKMPIRQGKKQ